MQNSSSMPTEEVSYDYSDILHLHCQQCYLSLCKEQENCIMVRCLYCGVHLHSCKIDDHETICTLAPGFCPNFNYGCPVRVTKKEQPKHLNVCPANVIQCGMEWNRFPLYSRERYTLTSIYCSQEDRIKQVREHWIPFIEINPPKVSGQLDIELAISDQRRLKREKQRKMAIGKWKASRRVGIRKIDRGRIDQLESLIGKSAIKESEPVLQGCDLVIGDHASVSNDSDSVIGNHDSEAMGSDVTASELNDSMSIRNDCEKFDSKYENKKDLIESVSSDSTDSTNQTIGESTTGKGKLTIQVRSSRNREEIKEKKLAALKNDACSNKEESDPWVHRGLNSRKNEVGTILGEAKTIEASQTVEVEKFESSASSDSDKSTEVLTFTVDVQQERYYTEKEAVLMPNPLVGMPPVPPQFPARLSEHIDDAYIFKELGLNVIIETIPKFQKNYPMYNFPCQVNLRRDQYCSHFKNVHGDIHGGLNSWIQHRCPLFQYGCSFVRHRLRPVSKEGCLVFDHDIDNFGVKPINESRTNSRVNGEEFSILDLPFELIERIAIYLDSFSMNQFSKTCRDTREVCQGLLQRRGIVLPEWKRGSYADGSILWRVHRKRWLFTPSFSHVSSWHFTDEPTIAEHMKTCKFYHKAQKHQKYKLPVMNTDNVKLKSDWR